jgi:mannose-P-dolichol utilization defect protein 1
MTRLLQILLLALIAFTTFTSAEEVQVTESTDGKKTEVPVLNFRYLLFREDCLDKFSQMDFSDGDCVALTFSKFIGYLIIAGATVFKLPQIMKIQNSGSVEGLSATSLYFETIGFINTLTYSKHLNLDLSVYGETFLVIAQNVIIIYLIWTKAKDIGFLEKIVMGSFMSTQFAILFQDTQVPVEVWTIVASSTVFINMLSRLPQII